MYSSSFVADYLQTTINEHDWLIDILLCDRRVWRKQVYVWAFNAELRVIYSKKFSKNLSHVAYSIYTILVK